MVKFHLVRSSVAFIRGVHPWDAIIGLLRHMTLPWNGLDGVPAMRPRLAGVKCSIASIGRLGGSISSALDAGLPYRTYLSCHFKKLP